MKKTLVASMLGLGLAASSYGQGVVSFNNYISTSFNQVNYATDAALGGLSGQHVVDPNVELQCFYAIGTFGSSAAFFSAATAGVTTFINPGVTYAGGGYYTGPNQTITGWTSGQTVTFAVEAWQTSGTFGGATFAQSLERGTSGLWTESAAASASVNGIQPAANPATGFAGGPPVMSIDLVPEPSTIALAGLGMASLLAVRRRK